MMNAIKIQATKIIGTRVTVYTAWELDDGHSTITHIDGVRYGRVGTARIPAAIDKLKPGSEERSVAVRGWYDAQYRRAYDLIVAEHPALANERRDMGEIEVVS